MRHAIACALATATIAVLVAGQYAAAEPMLFYEPVNVAEINSAHKDRDPALSLDGLEIFFTSNRPAGEGDWDIWYSLRPDTDSPFAAPVNLSEVNFLGRDANPHLSADHLTLYFTRSWPGYTSKTDIYAATRPDRSSPFSAPTPVTEVNTVRDEGAPHISADGLTLYFAYDIADYDEDLYVARRADVYDSFSAPVRIDQLSTLSYDRDPWVSTDERLMFFSSDRPTHDHKFRIWSASRAALDEPFGAAALVEGVNAGYGEGAPFFDEDRSLLYFHSSRPGGQGDLDIYAAQVVPEPFSATFMASALITVLLHRMRRRQNQ